jgi:hypothetical protein
MSSGISKCNIGAYDIVDNNDNLLMSWKTHDIDERDDEIGTTVMCEYCQPCNVVIHLGSS